ncbi:hypothetical protein CYJ57_02965 [Falseniella ignava]|uniref:Uncharacterized protein n=1 Tax=Falseniella ignava TaxID=137730 RepID=A0A2I1K2B5_9LACT|nr:hypothetical protein [Falseniella ignava]PKY89685.1 hypothetical protein CYJ57_02965 [Falseniella ignava]
MKKLLLMLIFVCLFNSHSAVAYGLELTDYEALITSSQNIKPTELSSGEWIVGEDIEPGRYNIKPSDEEDSGNIMINQKDKSSLLLNEVLGFNHFGGVEQIRVYLTGGEKIEIIGLDSVTFTPVGPEEKHEEIHAGFWIVGIDVEPGTYIATTEKEQSGNVFVTDKDGYLVTTEILGENMFRGVDQMELKLEEGYKIDVSNLSNVYLNKK